MTGAQVLVKALQAQGVEVIFGYPGAANAPLFDQLNRSDIRCILPRGEQAAAHEASGYAVCSGKVGTCLATSGPGATNLITGIATAYLDSVPMVAITGQVSLDLIGTDAFQEVDITGSAEPFTKHSYLLNDPADICKVVAEAYHIAGTGRCGPVLIDIPIDVLTAKAEYHEHKVNIRGYKPVTRGNDLQIKRVRDALAKSERPIFVVGGGVVASRAMAELAQISGDNDIPFVTTLMGLSAYPAAPRNYVGMIGTHGFRHANRAVIEADLIVVAGARLSDRACGAIHNNSKAGTIVHIDIDSAEIGKNMHAHLPVVGDVKTIFGQLLECGIEVSANVRSWRDSLVAAIPKREYANLDGFVNPKLALAKLSEMSQGSLIVATEVGQNQIWAARNYTLQSGQLVTSGGLGTMGYGIPAAIGAKVAMPERTVVAICGDGSFQMSMPELATIMQWNIPIKVIIFNNGHLGMVKELQYKLYNANYSSVDLSGSPDFIALAAAYNVSAARVSDNAALEQAFAQMLADDKPYLLELIVHPDESTM